MSEKIKNENIKPKNPLRSKWLILIGVLALLNILFLLLLAGIDLISMLKHISMRSGNTIGTFWFPYLGSLALSALMLLLISLGGFLRQNVLCAIGTLGYGLVFPLSTVMNWINGQLISMDKGRISYFSKLGTIIPTHFRAADFFRFYCYPGLIFLSIGIILLSVLYFIRTGKAGGMGVKIAGILIAVLSVLILVVSGITYSSMRIAFTARIVAGRPGMTIFELFVRGSRYYSHLIQKIFRELFRMPIQPSQFLQADILFTAFRIFASSVLFTAMGIIGAVTIPSKKIEKKNS